MNPNLIAKHKLESSAKDLCKGLPIEYATLLSYSQMLPFDAKPDYNYFSRLFSVVVPHEGTPVFDWDSGLVHLKTKVHPCHCNNLFLMHLGMEPVEKINDLHSMIHCPHPVWQMGPA